MGITYSLFGASSKAQINYADTLYSINDEEYNIMVHNLQQNNEMSEIVNDIVDNIIDTAITNVTEVSPAMSYTPDENSVPNLTLEDAPHTVNKKKKKRKKKTKNNN